MKHKIIEHLEFTAKLMALHSENAFKIKAYETAANSIYNHSIDEEHIANTEWASIKGVGNSIANTINEFITSGDSLIAKKYIHSTPNGILEMMLSIRGIGVKKIAILWKEHQIISIDQLYEQCKQKEIQKIKGFGEKLEEKITERIEFYFTNKGFKLYATSISLAKKLTHQLVSFAPQYQHVITGELRRQLPIVQRIEMLTNAPTNTLHDFLKINEFEIKEIHENLFVCFHPLYREVNFILSRDNDFGTQLFQNSASNFFIQQFKNMPISNDESDIFKANGLPFIPAFLRENEKYCNAKYDNTFYQNIIQEKDVKGLIHCHSKWSDGEENILTIANAAMAKGLEYMLLTDHSKSSFVANGLSEERWQMQFAEIDELNKKLHPFKIFKGVECDILGDGSLDYEDEFLAHFDLIIASVHNNLDMTKKQATERVLKAIQNPYTHILGHSSGRLLLNRKGYELDYEVIFDACVKHQVAVELNANPFRLDIDWTHLERMKALGILTSINPDAHSLKGIADIQFGIAAAQKGAITKSQNISSFSLQEFEQFIISKKMK